MSYFILRYAFAFFSLRILLYFQIELYIHLILLSNILWDACIFSSLISAILRLDTCNQLKTPLLVNSLYVLEVALAWLHMKHVCRQFHFQTKVFLLRHLQHALPLFDQSLNPERHAPNHSIPILIDSRPLRALNK